MIILVILDRYVVGISHFQPFKQFVKGRGVFVHILPYICCSQHFHYHRKILLIRGRFIFQVENERQQKHGSGGVPERVV